MRLLLSFLFVFTYLVGFSQRSSKEKLYYFMSKDSLVGVKNEKGKIIIPAVHYHFYDFEKSEEIKEDLIYLMPVDKTKREPHSWGSAYNRKGKFLFSPFAFDNGPDYLSEGFMRFVKNGKVGFVNREGAVVISAQYDYASPFNYGISTYCNGCRWKYEGEHSWVAGGDWGYINNKGEKLTPTVQMQSMNDQLLDLRQGADSGKYLPYQFHYTPFEQRIIDSFSKKAIISKAFFVNVYSPLDSNEKILKYEIVERPSDFFPYYHVKAFTFSNKFGYSSDEVTDDVNFYISKNGKEYFYYDYFDHLIPFSEWLKDFVAKARSFLQEHPEAPNRF